MKLVIIYVSGPKMLQKLGFANIEPFLVTFSFTSAIYRQRQTGMVLHRDLSFILAFDVIVNSPTPKDALFCPGTIFFLLRSSNDFLLHITANDTF